jgi:hypothetical protein
MLFLEERPFYEGTEQRARNEKPSLVPCSLSDSKESELHKSRGVFYPVTLVVRWTEDEISDRPDYI